MHLLQIHEPGQTPLPHEGPMPSDDALAVGIDLGTTNSLIALSVNHQPRLFLDENGDALLPSAYAVDNAGVSYVGQEALEHMQRSPTQGARSVKRLMGKGPKDIEGRQRWSNLELPTSNSSPSSAASGPLLYNLANTKVSPVQVSASLLKALKGRAEHHLDAPVKKAVITVPAYFDDAARQATYQAAGLAGLSVLRLLNEPTAAALAYGLDQGLEGTYMVYDLGGGTFDVSVLKLEKGVFRVLATGGDTQLGGDDIDQAIADHWLEQLRRESTSTPHEQQLLWQAKLAKEALCTQKGTEYVAQLPAGPISLTQETLRALSLKVIEKTLLVAKQVLEDIQVDKKALQGVVLVGGATKMPLVQSMVQACFGQAPLCDIDPETVVAYGAALQAEALTQPSDHLLIDVCPLSLGLETMGGIVEKLIPRNTAIPVAKAQEFTTFEDGQTAMKFHVVQGEREHVDHCRSLATFVLKDIPPQSAGLARIEVTFQIDANGILTVKAEEKTTGQQQEVQVKPTYGLTETDLRQIVEGGITHAAMDMEDRLLAEERVEAQCVLKALDKALALDGELLSPQARRKIDAHRQKCQDALLKDDRANLQATLKKLDRLTANFAEKRLNKAMSQALKGKNISALEIDAEEE